MLTGPPPLLEALMRILRGNLNDAALTVTDATRPDQVPGWSSIKMVDVVLDAEDAFGIRLSAEDLDGIATVGDLVRAIERRLEPPGRAEGGTG